MSSAFISEDEAKRQVAELLASEAPAPKPRKKPQRTFRYKERVAARLGKGGRPRDAIVTIDKAQTLRIRPFRGRVVYEMSMEQAVSWLMQKLVIPENVGKPRKQRRS